MIIISKIITRYALRAKTPTQTNLTAPTKKQYTAKRITSAATKNHQSTTTTTYCLRKDMRSEINVQVLSDLQLQLASLFVTAIVIQNTVEVLVPFASRRIKAMIEKRRLDQRGGGETVMPPKSDAEQQMDLVRNESTIDDMSEMVVQFGYVTMFVIALPITPLLSLINNIIELKVDGFKLVRESQRPHPNGSSGLGAWNDVLGFFSIVAVGTNVALITWRTSLVNTLISYDPTMKWVFFTFISIFLSILVRAEKWAIPDVPRDVDQGVERQKLIESVLVLGTRVDMDDDEPPKKDDQLPSFAFDPSKPFVESTTLPFIPLGDLSQLTDDDIQRANTQQSQQ
ncbi:hypothetical protein RFI_13873 [Reticulomyxa filosa]|uniref:Anoctamin transmembrane domain-containing protein n=1 Tax=Reticulomyxa filosa TaxID=46433 RepID=X6NAI5_RETFI|nr:hypothetical protein RFI_13873 [Reticulomyxa filosa]|eukprot:ETO23310.1 hypothetical protein RFI_13873 [Reticulomyxa filosa]